MLGALVAAAAFLLAVTRVEDPDTWTHLALGRLMVGMRGLPVREVLVFPSGALPYHNTEWLFDIVPVAPFGAALAGGSLLHLLRRGRAVEDSWAPTARQLKVVAGVLVVDILASLINPRGVEILTLPFQLAASPWFTQEVNELQRP